MAFPVGGEGFTQYILIELHYDNPKLISGAAAINTGLLLDCQVVAMFLVVKVRISTVVRANN